MMRGRALPLLAAGALLLAGGYRAAQRALTPHVRRALARALHIDPGAVTLGALSLRPPARLLLGDVKAGTIAATRIEIGLSPWDLLAGKLVPRHLRVTDLVLEGLGRAAWVEGRLGDERARLVAHQVRARVEGLPIEAGEVGLELRETRLERAAFSGARAGPLGDLSGVAQRRGSAFAIRVARPGLELSGTISRSQAMLRGSVEDLPLAGLVRASGIEVADAAVSGPLRLSRDPEGWHLEGRLAVSGLTLASPALAPRRLERIDPIFSGGLRLRRGMLELEEATIALGPLSIHAAGRLPIAAGLERGGAPAASRPVDLTLSVAPVGCAAALRALPPALLPTLEGMVLEGSLDGKMRLFGDLAQPSKLGLDVDLAVGCRVLADSPLAEVAALVGSGRPRIGARAHGPRPFSSGTVDAGWQALAELPWPVVWTFLVAEDARFLQHRGFDLEMIRRALGADLQAGRYERGASTITQQVVKNVFLSGDRSVSRKLEEAVLAWRLEQVLPKARILELYLNLVELAPQVRGLRDGSRHHFDKPPARLTIAEAAQLAALLPAPRRGMDQGWARRYQSLWPRLAGSAPPPPRLLHLGGRPRPTRLTRR